MKAVPAGSCVPRPACASPLFTVLRVEAGDPPPTIPLDGALLRFHRDSGTHVRIDADRFATLRQQAPRVVQFAITNRCNLACGFCSRDAAPP